MTSTPSGAGYWLIGRDRTVLPFGDAHRYGSAGVAMLSTPRGDARPLSGWYSPEETGR